MRTMWLLLLVPCHHSHVCQLSDPLHLPLKNLHVFTAARALLQSSQHRPAQPPPWWSQPISSPRHVPAQAGSRSCTSTRHWERPSKGSASERHSCAPTLAKDTAKKLRKTNRAKGTAMQNKNEWRSFVQAKRQNAFQMAFRIILFDVYLSKLFLLQYSAHLVISSWCVGSKHIRSTLLMK